MKKTVSFSILAMMVDACSSEEPVPIGRLFPCSQRFARQCRDECVGVAERAGAYIDYGKYIFFMVYNNTSSTNSY